MIVDFPTPIEIRRLTAMGALPESTSEPADCACANVESAVTNAVAATTIVSFRSRVMR
jgi:hypothetical protein